MRARADFAEYCLELLSAVGGARAKRMFGGYGLYVDGDFIAIVAGETLYLKADEQTVEQFEAAGCKRFEYAARGKTHALNYWTVPGEAMDAPNAMAPWARLALGAARRGAVKKARAKPRG